MIDLRMSQQVRAAAGGFAVVEFEVCMECKCWKEAAKGEDWLREMLLGCSRYLCSRLAAHMQGAWWRFLVAICAALQATYHAFPPLHPFLRLNFEGVPGAFSLFGAITPSRSAAAAWAFGWTSDQ